MAGDGRKRRMRGTIERAIPHDGQVLADGHHQFDRGPRKGISSDSESLTTSDEDGYLSF